MFKVTVNRTKLVAIRVGTCKPLKTKLTVFAELNYQPARYRGHQNKLDCITQQIIRKLRVWGFNFLYSHWILGKFILNLNKCKYFGCCDVPGSHWFYLIRRRSHQAYSWSALITDTWPGIFLQLRYSAAVA